MKTKFYLVSLLLMSLTVIFFSSFMPYPSGAPSPYYYTGSQGDGHDCSSCHGNSSTVSGWITSNIPGTGYVPGTTYQITATNSISGSGKYGFEVSPQNAAGTLLGTLAAGTNSKLVGSGKWITQNNASNSVTSWTFNWTAPAAGTGTVTFYGSFARSTGSATKLSTLVVNEAVGGMPGAAGPITGPTSACLGSSVNYSVGTISGATTYNWTVPAGASILSGQGTTTISVNFGAGSSSGNVSVYGSNTSGNGAPSNLAVTVTSAPSSAGTVSGSGSPCQGTSQTYSVSNVSGVTYTWTVPSGTTITSGQGTNALTVTVGPASGNIEVVPSNGCGNGPGSSLALSVSPVPAQPGAIAGPASACQGANATFTVDNVAGVAYTWSVPTGSTITSGQGTNSINVTVGYASGLIEVVPSNTCGSGPGRTLSFTANLLPQQPGFIFGTEWPCEGSSVTYNVDNVVGMEFTWTVPAGSTITSGQGTNSITVLVGNTSGDITVTAANSCGTSPAQTKAIQVTNAPAQPGTITGMAAPCEGSSQVYSVPAVSGLTYTWSIASGASITAGQGTNSVTVNVGNINGNIEVVANNSCGNSPGQSMSIAAVLLPGNAAAIDGPAQVNTSGSPTSQYSTAGAANATSYSWQLTPAEAGSILGSGLTAVVTWSPAFTGVAIIHVKGVNSCGEGAWSDNKEVIVLNNTGFGETEKSGIGLFPNPGNGHITITLNLGIETVRACFHDVTGKEVFRQNISGNGNSQLELPLPEGVYFLRIDTGSTLYTRKVMIR